MVIFNIINKIQFMLKSFPSTMYTQFFFSFLFFIIAGGRLGSYKVCLLFLCRKDKVRKKNSFFVHFYENVLLKYIFSLPFPSPCPLILGHLDLNNIISWTMFTGRHSGSLDILFYFDLEMDPGSLLLIWSLENISYCFCQAVS